MPEVSGKVSISPSVASIAAAISIVFLLINGDWLHLWSFSTAEVIILSLIAGDRRFIQFAVIAAATFSIPLLIIHGFINPHFSESFYLLKIIPVRLTGLEYAARIGGRLSIISNVGITVAYVPVIQGIKYLLKLRLPNQVVLPVAMSLALLKDIRRRASQVYETQQARGIPVSGSLLQRIRSLPSVILPVTVSTLIDSQRRADCLKSRGFERSMLFKAEVGDQKTSHSILRININAGYSVQLESGIAYDWVAPVNSGKSLLAREIALGDSTVNHVMHHTENGPTRDSRLLAKDIGWIPSDCRWLFSGLASTVEDEIFLAIQANSQVQNPDTHVKSILRKFQLDELRDHHPFILSGGESIRLALAIAFTKQPRFLILDQAFEFLDPDQRAIFEQELIRYRCENNLCICHFRNRPPIEGDEQRVGALQELKAIGEIKSQSEISSLNVNDQVVLQAKNLSFQYESGFSLNNLSLSITSGQVIILSGKNGVGKTTLLKILALLLNAAGRIQAFDPVTGRLEEKPRPRRLHLWARRVGYAFQNPTDQLFKAKVGQELTVNTKSPQDAERALRLFGLVEEANKNPYDIPLPLQRMTTLATVFAARPPVILLDEPTAFLDYELTNLLAHAIRIYAKAGHAFLIVTHDDFLMRQLEYISWILKLGLIRKTEHSLK